MRKRTIIILILAIALTALFFLGRNINKFSSDNKDNQPLSPNSPLSSNNFSIVLSSQNFSGQNGIATFEGLNNQTVIKIKTIGYPPEITQPAHIQKGTCENPGEIKYPLANTLNGESETTLNVNINKLFQKDPLVLNVYKSIDEVSAYVSCGQIKIKQNPAR